MRFDTDQPAGRPVREQREEHAVCAGASRGSSAGRLAAASARSGQRHWLPAPLVWSGAMTCAPPEILDSMNMRPSPWIAKNRPGRKLLTSL